MYHAMSMEQYFITMELNLKNELQATQTEATLSNIDIPNITPLKYLWSLTFNRLDGIPNNQLHPSLVALKFAPLIDPLLADAKHFSTETIKQWGKQEKRYGEGVDRTDRLDFYGGCEWGTKDTKNHSTYSDHFLSIRC